MNSGLKCVIILSTKSSGSSLVQSLLSQDPSVSLLKDTGHHENETLFWTKAASCLGLPQTCMVDSEIPLGAVRARAELEQLLRRNTGEAPPDLTSREGIFSAWHLLCERHGPVLVEKSPHHLLQESCLELIRDAIEVLPDIEFRLVGLIRSPVDVLYSYWDRWGVSPSKKAPELVAEARNLQRAQHLFGGRFQWFRYEDLVRDPSSLRRLEAFTGLSLTGASTGVKGPPHARSIGRWRQDRSFGHMFSDELKHLYRYFGYGDDAFQCRSHPDRIRAMTKWLWIRARRHSRRLRAGARLRLGSWS
jgi:hypothetical protein